MGTIGEQVLEPRRALAHGVKDRLRPGAVGDVRGGQVEHQQSSVGVDRNAALAADDLFIRVLASHVGVWRFDVLIVEHAVRRASISSGALAIQHQRHVMYGLEQHAPHKAPEPPIDRLPRAEVVGSIRQPPRSPRSTACRLRKQRPAHCRLGDIHARPSGASAHCPGRSGCFDARAAAYRWVVSAACRAALSCFHRPPSSPPGQGGRRLLRHALRLTAGHKRHRV